MNLEVTVESAEKSGVQVTPFGQRRRHKTGVAARQAAQKGKQRFFVPGQELGQYVFDWYVGGNETGLYIWLVAKCCGKRFPCKRDQVSTLEKRTSCVDCFRKRRALERKAKAA